MVQHVANEKTRYGRLSGSAFPTQCNSVAQIHLRRLISFQVEIITHFATNSAKWHIHFQACSNNTIMNFYKAIISAILQDFFPDSSGLAFLCAAEVVKFKIQPIFCTLENAGATCYD
jgi:hypothetical protein